MHMYMHTHTHVPMHMYVRICIADKRTHTLYILLNIQTTPCPQPWTLPRLESPWFLLKPHMARLAMNLCSRHNVQFTQQQIAATRRPNAQECTVREHICGYHSAAHALQRLGSRVYSRTIDNSEVPFYIVQNDIRGEASI